MAIKRPSKGLGKAVSRPMASAVRHVDVRGKNYMVPGQSYVGWLCKGRGCGLVIAISPVPPDARAAAEDQTDQLASVQCPHCGNEDLYHWNARATHVFAVQAPTVPATDGSRP